jgi:hypothetical protein
MATLEGVTLSNKVEIDQAKSRLLQFCRHEYDYYDGLPQGNPDRIEPIDVLATVSVNSFITNAAQVNRIHRGMAEKCDGLLRTIPPDADLLTCPQPTLNDLEDLLHTAVQLKGVLIAVATKILHRKRPNLIPMLDNIVLEAYLDANGLRKAWGRTGDKQHAANVAMQVIEFFRNHLQSVLSEIEFLQKEVAQERFILTRVRILEILVWIAKEQRGYYRNA